MRQKGKTKEPHDGCGYFLDKEGLERRLDLNDLPTTAWPFPPPSCLPKCYHLQPTSTDTIITTFAILAIYHLLPAVSISAIIRFSTIHDIYTIRF